MQPFQVYTVVSHGILRLTPFLVVQELHVSTSVLVSFALRKINIVVIVDIAEGMLRRVPPA